MRDPAPDRRTKPPRRQGDQPTTVKGSADKAGRLSGKPGQGSRLPPSRVNGVGLTILIVVVLLLIAGVSCAIVISGST